MSRPMLAAALLALAACAGPDTKKVTDAAAVPFEDLNLVKAKIPAVLLESMNAPYARPLDAGCAALIVRVKALDEALGPDLDAPVAAEQGILERGGKLAEEQAYGALRGAAEGLIPYRSWVRKLTGAERQTRLVAAAVAAGGVQRAYLKGLGTAAGCEPPAAPIVNAKK